MTSIASGSRQRVAAASAPRDRRAPRPPARRSTLPDGRVSVVIATRDRCDTLLETLGRLARLPERPRLVVVDNGSQDGTADAVRRLARGVVVVEPGFDLGAAARSLGVLQTRTPYVAFSDDDSWWEAGALARAADHLDRCPPLAIVAARVLLPGGRLDAVARVMGQGAPPSLPGLPGPEVHGFLACGAVVRRDAFLSVGGFHPRLGVGGEEELLATDLLRAGWRLAYAPDVVAHHHPSPLRNGRRRRELERRNRLLVRWLREPLGAAVAASFHEAGRALREPESRRALGELAGSLPWVLRERRAHRPPPV
jgi:GT2 family glycosyltransferase